MTGFAVYYAVEKSLEERMGEQLLGLGRLAAGQLAPRLPDSLPLEAEGDRSYPRMEAVLKPFLKWGVLENISILDQQGTVLLDATGEAVEGFRSNLLTRDQLNRLGSGESLVLPVRSGDFGLLHQSVFLPLGPKWVLQVDADPLYLGVLKRFRRIFVFFGLLGILVSVTAGVFVARTVLQPVGEVVTLAQDVAEGRYPETSPSNPRLDELGQLVTSIHAMAGKIREREQELNALAESLKTIASGIAHEVRNSLSVIGAQSEWIAKKAGDKGDLGEAALNIRKHVEGLERFINRFLQYSRPQSLRLEPLSLAGLAGTVLQGLKEQARARGIVLETDFSHCRNVLADAALLGNALSNLVLNALQATPEGGTVSLRLREEGPLAVLSVEDTGPGIAGEDLEKIFQPFFTTKSSGTGLGLAIADKIARGHGGKLAVTNRAQGGASFRLSLPLQGELP